MAEYIKDPNSILDYGRDWSKWLESGDTIASSTWTADPANPDTSLTITSDTHTGTQTTAWLAGGTVGATYRITNRITTVGGRTEERTDQWNVLQRRDAARPPGMNNPGALQGGRHSQVYLPSRA